MSTTQSKTTTPKKTASKKVVAKKVAAPKKVATPTKTVAKKAAATKKVAPKKAAPKKTAKGGATKATKATKAVTTATSTETEGNSKTRFFKVLLGDDSPKGRFSGNKPKQAANKALTSIFKAKEQSGGSITGKVKFSIVECTRGSKHKKYHYVGERIQLDQPMKVTIGKGADKKTIEYKFNNRVMKDKNVTV